MLLADGPSRAKSASAGKRGRPAMNRWAPSHAVQALSGSVSLPGSPRGVTQLGRSARGEVGRPLSRRSGTAALAAVGRWPALAAVEDILSGSRGVPTLPWGRHDTPTSAPSASPTVYRWAAVCPFASYATISLRMKCMSTDLSDDRLWHKATQPD